MGKINFETIEVSGFLGAIKGLRKSYRTETASDSVFTRKEVENNAVMTTSYYIGQKDLNLMKQLAKKGNDEAKFMRCIHVQVEINAPLYFWKQLDTYKIGTTRLSDSTMHNITKDMITEDMFAAESVLERPLKLNFQGEMTSRTMFMFHIQTIEQLRMIYLRAKNTVIDEEYRKTYGEEAFKKAVEARKQCMYDCWKQIVEFLPDSFMISSIFDTNYQMLRGVYFGREGHKLSEWEEMRAWIESLPYSEIITCRKNEEMRDES